MTMLWRFVLKEIEMIWLIRRDRYTPMNPRFEIQYSLQPRFCFPRDLESNLACHSHHAKECDGASIRTKLTGLDAFHMSLGRFTPLQSHPPRSRNGQLVLPLAVVQLEGS